MRDLPQMLTVPEVADALRCHPKTVLKYCADGRLRSVKLARVLLEHGMDPDLPNWQQIRPLHHLAARGEIDKAKLFLEFGANSGAIDEEYRSTPLGWAARSGQTDFVRFWLETGEKGSTGASVPQVPAWARPIEWARRRGHAEIADLLDRANS